MNVLSYRPEIDGLRGLAVLLVILFHAFPQVLPGGYLGVDVFFVISGFLITRLIDSEIFSGTFHVKEFYARRARRLLPALFLVLSSVLLVSWFVLLPMELRALGKQAAAGAMFLSNFFIDVGYFDPDASSNPLLHLWSLGVEEQFYLVWPFFLLWLSRRFRSPLKGILSAAVLSLVYAGMTHMDPKSFYSPLTRFWELGVGALFVFWKPRLSQDKAGWLGIALLTAGVVASPTLPPLAPLLLVTIGTGWMIFAGSESFCARKLLNRPGLIFIGKISYPLYLWHWPLLFFIGKIDSSPLYRGFALLIAVGFAFATYRWVETKWRGLPPLGRQWKAGLAATMACALLGSICYFTRGFPRRLPEKIQAYAIQTEDWNRKLIATPECQKQYGDDQVLCTQSDDRAAPTVLLVGDSHANQFFPGLSTIFRQRKENLVNLGSVSCPAVLGVSAVIKGSVQRPCRVVSEAIEMAIAREEIHTVMLAARWQIYVPRELGGDWRLQGENSGQPVLFDALKLTIARLRQHGKRVIVFLDSPDLGISLNDCIRPHLFRADCTLSLEDILDRQRHSREHVAEIARQEGAFVVDALASFCDEKRCYGLRPTPMYRADGSHLSLVGSELFSRAVNARYQELFGTIAPVRAPRRQKPRPARFARQ